MKILSAFLAILIAVMSTFSAAASVLPTDQPLTIEGYTTSTVVGQFGRAYVRITLNQDMDLEFGSATNFSLVRGWSLIVKKNRTVMCRFNLRRTAEIAQKCVIPGLHSGDVVSATLLYIAKRPGTDYWNIGVGYGHLWSRATLPLEVFQKPLR